MKNISVKKWLPIALFYVIAIVVRALSFNMDRSNVVDMNFFLRAWAEGIGPCIGAIIVVLLFGRKFFCSITGTSIIKSVVSIAIPFLICFVLYRELSFVLLGFIFYSFLEEVGWRGYLQGEFEDKSPMIQSLIIGVMWYLWHIHISLSIGSIMFLVLLIFGSWGIGRIARDTHSLVACACFHVLFNFSNKGFFEFTPSVIALYVVVIMSWFLIWYAPWGKWLHRR